MSFAHFALARRGRMEAAMSSRAALLASVFAVLVGVLTLKCGGSENSSNSAPLTDPAYFAVRPDARACPSPACGGFWVVQLNQAVTHCADGSTAGEVQGCYVAELNSDVPGLAEKTRPLGQAIVKGKIVAKSFGNLGNLGEIDISETWQPVTTP